VPKGAKDERLVILESGLLLQRLDECLDLPVLRIEVLRHLNQFLDLGPNAIEKAHVHGVVAIGGFDKLQLVELPVEHVREERGKSVEAACSLTPYGRHHEFDVLLPVATRENTRNDAQQPVM
jgi:hypothetical protein